MDKIQLPDESKFILVGIAKHLFCPSHTPEENGWIAILEEENLISVTKDTVGGYIKGELTTKGRAYLATNPELKNPSFWDDKHAVVDHFINVIKFW